MEAVDKNGQKDVGQRILDAAYDCFDRDGITSTSLGEIAVRAGVSRPTVYRYFGNKSDLVETISELESVKIKNEVQVRLRRIEEFEPALVEALATIIKIASKNIYIKRILEDPNFAQTSIDPNGRYHKLQKAWWGNFLMRAMTNGQICDDLELDEIVSWLTACMRILLIRVDQISETDEQLRYFIHRFVVYPLVTGSDT